MYKIPANTLFIGKNLVYVPECHSTNTLASELGQKTATPEGTVVITDRQTAGKGQRGNTWQTEDGKNLTFSVLLNPNFLSVQDQFNLTMLVSLAIHSMLADVLRATVKIKWPNDIIVNDKKVCGILIENVLKGNMIHQSIAGIGLNVNQEIFPMATATSMKVISNSTFDQTDILSHVLEHLESRYLQLRSGQVNAMRNHYLNNLYWKGEERTFRVEEKEISGTIVDVDRLGKLIVQHRDGTRAYDLKEIAFVR